ncbi:MAG: type II toxin-antitoxin system VapC family toxin [Nitrospiria bacterium]
MITSVDTNILLDVFGADPLFGRKSALILKQCRKEGALVARDVVWIETASIFLKEEAFLEAIHTLEIAYSGITQETSMKAVSVWRKYREEGGKRDRVAADFMIGSHAIKQSDRILTRDRGFYRKYFKPLNILDPSA